MVSRFFPLPETTGGLKRAARLVEAMQRAGADPWLLTTDDPGSEALAAAAERGWTVRTFPQPGLSPTRRVAMHLRGDMVATPGGLAAELGRLAGHAAFFQFEEIGALQFERFVARSDPTIASTYNVDSRSRRNPYEHGWVAARARYRGRRMDRLERRAVARATGTLCVSEADLAHFRAAGARALLVPNGVDASLFQIDERVPPTSEVLFFGALAYPPNLYGITRFIRRSWPLVLATEPDARLRIAGAGPPAELVGLARTTPGVELLGFVPDLDDELTRCRLVIAPIWFGGGTRIKVLEALAAARPVAGTSLGVEQIGFVDQRHGLVRDDDGTLAEAVVELLRDRERAAAFGAEGRRLAQTYRWERVTGAAEALYRELLEVAPHRSAVAS